MTAHSPSAEFRLNYPTPRGRDRICDEQDLQRAIEAYRFFYPTVSMEASFNGTRELGIEDGKGIMVLATKPSHLIFTANSDTPYGAGVIDLKAMGPVVIDVPPGPYVGLLDDHHYRWIVDMGIPGPDGDRGGKFLVLPPGYHGELPTGYRVCRSDTHKVLFAMRAIPLPSVGGPDGALEALQRVRVYPVGNPGAVMPYRDVTNTPFDATPLRWEDNLAYWEKLHAVLEEEPPLEEHRPMYGVLAALGIERGRLFAPDARMKRILEKGAVRALEQMRVEGFASGRPDRIVWNERRWEWVGLVEDDPNFETADYLDLQARDRWFVQAIAASPAMFRRRAGSGSLYFLAATDANGAYLDGGKSYRLRIPQPVPAKLFWSVTVYDTKTRSQVQTPQGRAVLGSLTDKFETNADGSIDVYFGPTSPSERKGQWIQTTPGAGFFIYFRIYGPEEASLDGSWMLDDVQLSESEDGARLDPSSTPDIVHSRVGALRFTHGVPTRETVDAVYDNLDVMRGVDTFLNAFQAVSLQAIRNGFLDVGVRDNDVLLFSELMDAQSLFLTANCDTVYFWSFIDLSAGPMVLEVPERVLGVLDDMWFRWVIDVGLAGPDRGEGGRYLLVPPGYDGPLPEGGYYIARAQTHRLALLGRAFLEQDRPEPAATRIRQQLTIYPYVPGTTGSSVAHFLAGEGSFGREGPHRAPRFVEGTGLVMNTIPPNDASFFALLDRAVQAEPAEALDPELAGQFAAIGIVKGRPFEPDARMRKLLDESVALANAMARTVAVRPRLSEEMRYYDASSQWTNPLFVGGYEFLRPPPLVHGRDVEQFPAHGARTLNARTAMFYLATGITPAMCMRLTHIGSQYVGAFLDKNGDVLDGGRSYRVTLPPDIPAALFWSFTVYDNQTRSMLATPQRFPRAGSQAYPTPAAVANADGSTAIYFGPKRPEGVAAGNWIQTAPGKGWFPILRLYSPLEPFFDKTWRPSEIEPMP